MKQISRQYLLLLITIAAATGALCQMPDYHVQMIMKKAGLTSLNQVEGLIKDNKGFLWLLTPSKAQRFDGKNIMSFPFEDRCINIQQDTEGTIWVAARQGIYQFKNDYTGFEKLEGYNSDIAKYRSLLAGPGKKIYLLTTDGILRWNSAAKKMEPFGIAPFKSTGSFPFLKSFGNWLFYKLSNTALARYNVITGAADSVQVKDALQLIPVNDDSVWVREGIDNSALVSFTAKTVTSLSPAHFDETVSGSRLCITGGFTRAPGEFFALLEDMGYYVYLAKTKRFKKVNLFHYGSPVTAKPMVNINNPFYRESNGTVWFVNEEGLVYFKPDAHAFGLLRSHNPGAGPGWNNDIRNITEDDNGNIWFGTTNGFCKWDKKSGRVLMWKSRADADTYLNYPVVKSVGLSKDRLIIGQSEKGFWIFNTVSQIFTRPWFENDSLKESFEREFNNNMIRLRNGNFLVLSNRAWLIDKETLEVRQLKLTDTAVASRTAYEDAQGRIWMLSRAGIFVFDSSFKMQYALPDRVRGKWYNAVVQVDEETYWVAAKSLFEIKLQSQGRMAIRPIFPELKNEHFSNLFIDSLRHIWMCTEEGMYRYIPAKQIMEKFDQADNVQNFYMGASNSFRGSDGTVYIGSMNGINYFIPEKLPLQQDSLRMVLLNVEVNSDDSSFLLKPFLPELRYDQNSMLFEFIAPYLYNAEKIQYRCRLEGIDKGWVSLGNNTSVRYTSLPSGIYSFHAAASLNGTDWFETNEAYSFTIMPPFWQSWWFRTLIVLAAAGLPIFYFRSRIKKVKAKAAISQQMAEMETKALRAQMNPHFIFNCMAAIDGYISRNEKKQASEYLNQFAYLIRKVLEHSRQKEIDLVKEIESLDLYIRMEQLRFQHGFDYAIHADEELLNAGIKIPPLILQPFAENAILHGLRHLKNKRGLLKITIQRENGNINCLFEDNGVGRSAAASIYQHQGRQHQPLGATIIGERIRLLKLSENISGEIEYDDLKDNESQSAGTRVKLSLKNIAEQ